MTADLPPYDFVLCSEVQAIASVVRDTLNFRAAENRMHTRPIVPDGGANPRDDSGLIP